MTLLHHINIPSMRLSLTVGLWFCWMVATAGQAYRNPYGKLPNNPTQGDKAFASFFEQETKQLTQGVPSLPTSAQAWDRLRPKLKSQLLEMLGLDPLPERTPLHPEITGRLDHAEFSVEKIHFQSRPQLYATANLYIPKGLTGRVPAILYVCGHAQVKSNGVSYGNKIAYQHHGAWFARNGYVCLVLDSIQLGELEGIHHGTYREKMWWWNSRGFTPAGAEAWNCLRALDYLRSRPEVDASKLGVTGRSGGGAYSWWSATLDEAVAAACPVAGITDLENHVRDGVVEGHCDCMYFVNTYRWDYSMLASMVAPRPLLIANTDKDTIFPLDGVVRLHSQTRHVYDLLGAWDKLGLLITEGGHNDTQDLQVPVLRWFNRWLKQKDSPITNAATPFFSARDLKVFDSLPQNQITRTAYENFTVLTPNVAHSNPDKVIETLRAKTFGGWPNSQPNPIPRSSSTSEVNGLKLEVLDFESQPGISLRLYHLTALGQVPRSARFEILDAATWTNRIQSALGVFGTTLVEEGSFTGLQMTEEQRLTSATWATQLLTDLKSKSEALVWFAPRGIGLNAVTDSGARYFTQLRRRFMLLGQTLAGMQAWDITRAAEVAARKHNFQPGASITWVPSSEMREIASFASLFSPNVKTIVLPGELRDDKAAPDFLNWRRITSPVGLRSLLQFKNLLPTSAAP